MPWYNTGDFLHRFSFLSFGNNNQFFYRWKSLFVCIILCCNIAPYWNIWNFCLIWIGDKMFHKVYFFHCCHSALLQKQIMKNITINTQKSTVRLMCLLLLWARVSYIVTVKNKWKLKYFYPLSLRTRTCTAPLLKVLITYLRNYVRINKHVIMKVPP